MDKPFALPYSSALRNIQVIPVAEIGLEFRARTNKNIQSIPIQDLKYQEIYSQEFQWKTTARAHSCILPTPGEAKGTLQQKKREIVWYLTKGGLHPPPFSEVWSISRFFL